MEKNDIFDFIQKFLDEKSKSFQPFKKKEENKCILEDKNIENPKPSDSIKEIIDEEEMPF